MFTKPNLLATAAAAVVMFLPGYLLWGIAGAVISLVYKATTRKGPA